MSIYDSAAQATAEANATKDRRFVTRYVITHIGKAGYRTLAQAAQGRFTFEHWDTAARAIHDMYENNSMEDLAKHYGLSLEVRPCKCYAGHYDPAQVVFDNVIKLELLAEIVRKIIKAADDDDVGPRDDDEQSDVVDLCCDQLATTYGLYPSLEHIRCAIVVAGLAERFPKATAPRWNDWEVDALVRKYVTGFASLASLCDAPGGYRPTIRCTKETNRGATKKELAELLELANTYDSAQIRRGDPRRAYRGD